MIDQYTTTDDICDCNPTIPDCHHESCQCNEEYSDEYPLGGSVEPYDIQRDNELMD